MGLFEPQHGQHDSGQGCQRMRQRGRALSNGCSRGHGSSRDRARREPAGPRGWQFQEAVGGHYSPLKNVYRVKVLSRPPFPANLPQEGHPENKTLNTPLLFEYLNVDSNPGIPLLEVNLALSLPRSQDIQGPTSRNLRNTKNISFDVGPHMFEYCTGGV